MNDLGLDESIQELARETERTVEGGKSTINRRRIGPGGNFRREPVKGQNHARAETTLAQINTRWASSTAFPLVAAAFGPLASLASVCALVETWQVHIPLGGEETAARRVNDPAWLIAVNAVSLALALVANVCLLLAFSRRIRYQLAQPIVIVLWYLSSLLLVLLVSITPKRFQLYPRREYALSQSYYYGILSSTIYFMIASFLLANYFNGVVLKRHPPTFNTLTLPQRTLMLETITFTSYLGIGALVFSKIEGWDYVDGVYWADFTLLTIGIGTGFELSKTLSKALLIPYAIGGIISLGLVVGSVRSLVLERGKAKVERRVIEKERTKWIELLSARNWEGGDAWTVPPCGEGDRLRDEFHLMRRIEDSASRKIKWRSFATSLSAWMVLWLGGAMVFMFSEKRQRWSYFDSLYFSYTSLLTIGYGDLYPESNSGKPFFVVWTMIAVPALTILISDMGDTVVRIIQKAISWVGAKTILPDPIPSSVSQEERGDGEKTAPPADQDQSDQLLGRIAAEIRMLTKHVGASPPRRYSLEEWLGFLELLGQDGDEWSWLNEDGPLASSASEAEWLLEKMCERLEGDLLRL